MKASKQVKIFIMAVLAVLAVILVIQNMGSVPTTLLVKTVPMPLAILLIVTMGIGFAVGLIAAGVWFARK